MNSGLLTEPEKKLVLSAFHLPSNSLLVLALPPHPVSATVEPVPLLDYFITQIENISLCSYQAPEFLPEHKLLPLLRFAF